MTFIEIKNISKSYGNKQALNNVSIELEKGKIYGLLGRNGAGKTTLINILTNKIFSTSGVITYEGENVVENDNVQSRIYSMVEKSLYPESTKVKDIIKWSKYFYPEFDTKYASSLISKFGLDVSKKVKELSTGYSSIFKIIIALSCNAEILIFDEPVLGLDANHRDLFYKEVLNRYIENEQTMIISTHLVQEIAEIVEEVIIIDSGEILVKESVENLLRKGFTVSGPAKEVNEYVSDLNVLGEDTLGGLKSCYVMGQLNKQVPVSLEVSKMDLQTLFVYLTTKEGER